MQGIYQIRNKIDGKRYIGSAKDIDCRCALHSSALAKGKHDNPRLQNAWNKHGEENFVFEAIEIVGGSRDNAYDQEQECLDKWLSTGLLYNINKEATAPPRRKGKHITQKSRDSISKALKKYFETHDGQWKGKQLSQEHRDNISQSLIGREVSQEHRGKISIALTGRKDTQEARGRRSIALKEWCKLHGSSFKGRQHTQGARSQMSLNSGRAKPYPAFYNVKTEECISAGFNLKRLCRENQMCYEVMWNIMKGIHQQTPDGWVLADE